VDQSSCKVVLSRANRNICPAMHRLRRRDGMGSLWRCPRNYQRDERGPCERDGWKYAQDLVGDTVRSIQCITMAMNLTNKNFLDSYPDGAGLPGHNRQTSGSSINLACSVHNGSLQQPLRHVPWCSQTSGSSSTLPVQSTTDSFNNRWAISPGAHTASAFNNAEPFTRPQVPNSRS
jgi:hypothetical protein